jgi:hypothetical protein
VKFLRSRRGVVVLAAILLILLWFRPGVRQLRYRIVGSISSALGRKVTLNNVRIHLLPRPGFDLEGLVIHDDPAFSAEPMVRAQDVSAAIRLSSLFRGRLEIATLSASDPSINLVRNEEGRWNLASLLERSAHIPAAPTGKSASERRPAFPYLEATHARINFKIGQAKKSLALTDADVALWQESENSWGARLRAQPVRTDFNLTDTGVVQLNATWQRAPSLSDTPVQVSAQWQRGQLGQITKLFTGGDRGWRGNVTFIASISGTPNALLVRSQASIEDFRRYDIMSSGSLRLSTACTGKYSTQNSTITDLSCESPVGGGLVRLRGSVTPIASAPRFDMTLTAVKVPLASLLQALRHAKKGLPADLVASGQVNGEFHSVKTESGMRFTGQGIAADARLASNSGEDEITFGDIPLTVSNADEKRAKSGKARSIQTEVAPLEARLQVGPFPLAMGEAAPAIAAGWLSSSGYRFSLRGDTEVKNIYRLANMVGLPGFHPIAEGAAHVDASVSGGWQGFGAPQAVGTAQLRNVKTGMRGLNPPIEIASAILKVDPDSVSLEKITAKTGDTHWSGAVRAPRPCAPEGCVFQFDLGADELSSGGLAEWFTPHPTKRPWYRILASAETQGKSPLVAIQARGRLGIHRLRLKEVDVSQIVAQVDLDRGKVILTDLRGQLFEGTHQGDWIIDVSVKPPHYQGKGRLQNVSMAEVSAAMNDAWVTGTADGNFDLTSSGVSSTELLGHAEGELQFTLRNGTLPHIELPDASKPFSVRVFAAEMKVKNGIWKVSTGKLESHDGIYQVSGTASPASGLNIIFTRGDEQSWNITGTLLKPNVAHATRTEARTVVKP